MLFMYVSPWELSPVAVNALRPQEALAGIRAECLEAQHKEPLLLPQQPLPGLKNT